MTPASFYPPKLILQPEFRRTARACKLTCRMNSIFATADNIWIQRKQFDYTGWAHSIHEAYFTYSKASQPSLPHVPNRRLTRYP